MFSGISIWQLLIILAIIMLLFGTKKLRNMGGDLGSAIKGFKDSMKDGEKEKEDEKQDRVIENGESRDTTTGTGEEKEKNKQS